MINSRIRLAPPSKPMLPVRFVPRDCLVRWSSRYEGKPHYSGPDIFLTQAAYLNINQHVMGTLNLEVGGMLVGGAYLSPVGKTYVLIEDALPANHVLHSRVHLTFTSDALADLLSRLHDSAPHLQIVGWYHTHPGLSIFLSSMDIWLHTHFFPEPWHVALVVDPQADHGGFFTYGGSPAVLDPQAYRGFYELAQPGANNGTSSVVSWLNLQPVKPDFTGALWETAEKAEERLP